MQIIDTQNKLDEALRDINSNKIIGVDTEFVRTNSFWPKLCTIQISTKSNFYLIDALSNVNNERLWEAFTNKDIITQVGKISKLYFMYHRKYHILFLTPNLRLCSQVFVKQYLTPKL